jgi:hypothetical protein
MDWLEISRDQMTAATLTVAVLLGAAYLWREQRQASSIGLVLPEFHALVPLSQVTQSPETTRDFARTYHSRAVSVRLDGGALVPIDSVLADPENIANLFKQWFPDSAADLGSSALKLLSVGGVVSALEVAELPSYFQGSVYQPVYVLEVAPRSSLVVGIYGFTGSPVMGDRPDLKHTPWALRLRTNNLADGGVWPMEVTVTVGAANGIESSVDLIS